jgi:hypothetical protein
MGIAETEAKKIEKFKIESKIFGYKLFSNDFCSLKILIEVIPLAFQRLSLSYSEAKTY